MYVQFPIVGIRHYGDVAALLGELEAGVDETIVWLEAEDDNVYDPGRAVAAYVNHRKVGYVSSLVLPILRPAMVGRARIESSYVSALEDGTAFMVQADLPTNEYPPYEPSVKDESIHGVAVPKRDVSREQLADEIEEVIAILDEQEAETALGIIDMSLRPLCEIFLQQFGTSLSGDDIRLYQRIVTAIQQPLLLLAEQDRTEAYPNFTENSLSLMWELYERYKGMSSSPSAINSIYKKELARARKVYCAKGGLWSQLRSVINRHPHPLDALESEQEARRQWLQSLPDNIGSFVGRPELGSRLFYHRFSCRELDLIYANIIVLAECDKLLAEVTPREERKKALAPYWNPKGDRYQRRRANGDLEHALQLPRGRYAAVARWVRKWEHLGALQPHFGGNRAAFCKDVEARFGVGLDPSTLLKAMERS